MLEQMGIAAKAASWQLALLSSQEKNQVLEKIADYLEAQTDDILRANAEDLAEARANGLSEAMLDRLALTGASERHRQRCAPGVQSGRSGRPGDRRRAAGQRSAY